MARYTDKKSFRMLVEGPRRRLLQQSNLPQPDSDYIQVYRRKSSTDTPLDTYRAISTKENRHSDADSESLSGSEPDSDVEERTLTAEQETTKRLEAALHQSPQDVDLWFKLLDVSLSVISPLTKNLQEVRTQISLAVIERAISAGNKYSLKLRVAFLEYGQDIWTSERLQKEWDAFIKDLDDDSLSDSQRSVLWLSWLEWRLSTNRTIEQSLTDFEMLFRKFRGSQYEQLRVKLLWRVALFLRDSGMSVAFKYGILYDNII